MLLTPDQQPDHDSLFLRAADWVSEVMGRPANIMCWLLFVVLWTAIFAAHLVPANGSFLPGWFTGQGYNFPLNLLTTVAELFIGFLVAAATNRAQRALTEIINAIRATVEHISSVEDRLADQLAANTVLTQRVHDLTEQVHALVSGDSKSSKTAG